MATETMTHSQASLTTAAVEDAMTVAYVPPLSVLISHDTELGCSAGSVDLEKVGEREARKLMSAEHKGEPPLAHVFCVFC